MRVLLEWHVILEFTNSEFKKPTPSPSGECCKSKVGCAVRTVR